MEETRLPSSRPSTKLERRSSLESCRVSLLIFIVESGCDLARSLFLEALLVFRRQDLPGHFRGGIDNQTAELALQLQHRSLVLDRTRFARFRHDLFRSRDGFLLLPLRDNPRA